MTLIIQSIFYSSVLLFSVPILLLPRMVNFFLLGGYVIVEMKYRVKIPDKYIIFEYQENLTCVSSLACFSGGCQTLACIDEL